MQGIVVCSASISLKAENKKQNLILHKKGVIKMLGNFLQDWLINKLNGYFMILYATDHFILAWFTEHMNSFLVFFLVLMHLIPPRRRIFL